jgi:hypothetical protein
LEKGDEGGFNQREAIPYGQRVLRLTQNWRFGPSGNSWSLYPILMTTETPFANAKRYLIMAAQRSKFIKIPTSRKED